MTERCSSCAWNQPGEHTGAVDDAREVLKNLDLMTLSIGEVMEELESDKGVMSDLTQANLTENYALLSDFADYGRATTETFVEIASAECPGPEHAGTPGRCPKMLAYEAFRSTLSDFNSDLHDPIQY